MGFINLAEKTVHAKLVYYGIGMGGKTTSLQAVHGTLCPVDDVKLVSINTDDDATLLFDFLPINLGLVEGFQILIQGFTVPGQPKYKLMRKYVLSGADAVVLVVDSQSSRLEENIEALKGLQENLRLNGLDPETIPIVMQYNKRDLDDILSSEELDRHFLFRDDIQAFPSVANKNQGVFETFVHAAGLLVEAKVGLYGLGQGAVDPTVVAESARRKLWEVRDQVRGETVDVDSVEKLELTFEESGGRRHSDTEPTTSDVFSDEELDAPLALDGVVEPDYQSVPEELQHDADLLDRAVQSNLQLAEAFGELDQYKAALERKNEELVKVAQNAVHDLNRPLSVIKLTLSSAAKGYLGAVPDKLAAGIDNALLAVRQMERLLGDFMDSSRLDFDGIKLDFAEVDLMLLVADVVRTLKTEIEAHNVGVRLEPLPALKADEWALTKAFFNLIGNAIQYSSPDRPPRVRISAEDRGEMLVLKVEDNGIGIPKEYHARIFQRFERADNTNGISGTGLGLHIVREIVQGHGGHIEISSQVGKGTCFRLFMPKEPVQVPHFPVMV